MLTRLILLREFGRIYAQSRRYVERYAAEGEGGRALVWVLRQVEKVLGRILSLASDPALVAG